MITGKYFLSMYFEYPTDGIPRFDSSGNIVEHYSDGDLVNEDTPTGREPAAPDTLYVWGPNLPRSFITMLPDPMALQEQTIT